MNILLDNKQRELYKPAIEELFRLCPETMQRKIPEANVQQGFIFDMVKRLASKDSKILCVGSHEDTACEALQKLGYNVIAIDPLINMPLSTFFKVTMDKFDVIFSTSVLEHVDEDEQFIEQICQLLNPNGYGILTCDFRDDYKAGDGKPGENEKLFTQYDLTVRLKKIIEDNQCTLFGKIDYSGKPDFCYGIHWYSFASLTFLKGGNYE